MVNQEDCFEALSQLIIGEVIQPSDEEYEEARQLYNGMIDKAPRVIIKCQDVADIKAAIGFAKDQKLPLAIRSGGHNGAGLASCDDGLVIDLSCMKGIRVDPVNSTVRVEPGCTQGDLDHATAAFNLAVPCGIVGLTGVSGLTLGGGHGYLTRQHGLTIDNLLEADIMLASGELVTVNLRQNEDLFWAIRGGGGNFGVVTSFLFQAHPVSQVYAGPMFWDYSQAKFLMKWYRDFQKVAPEQLCCFIGLKSVPSTAPFPEEIWGQKICVLISCFNGPITEGETIFNQIRNTLPKPLLDWAAPMAFKELQSMFDELLPKGMQWYWKGDYVNDLTDEAIDVHLKYADQTPSELSLMHLYPIDGAVHRVGRKETAWDCRDATWSMVIAGIDPDPGNAERISNWAQSYWEEVHPHNRDGAYINFMMEEGTERIRSSYGENYDRLVAIKRKYDPENFFRINQNIPPD